MIDSTNPDIRNMNSQGAASIRQSVNSTQMRPSVTDAASESHSSCTLSSSEVSLREDDVQEIQTLPSFGRRDDSGRRHSPTVVDDEDDCDRFVSPGLSSPVSKVKLSSSIIDRKLNDSTSSNNTIFEAKIAAELCGSPRLPKVNKGKSIAREPSPTTNTRKMNFLPTFKEDSHSLSQLSHRDNQTTNSRSNSLHSRFVTLDQVLASADTSEAHSQQMRPRDAERDQETIKQLRSQSLIHEDRIKDLHTQTKGLAETLKGLRRMTARDIQNLKDNSEKQRESSDLLVRGWEGMRRELLELKVRMVRETVGQTGVDKDEAALPFPPPHSLTLSASTPSQEDASNADPYPLPLPDSLNLYTPPTTALEFDSYPVNPGAPIQGQRGAPLIDTPAPLAAPSLARIPPAYHSIDPGRAYNAVPQRYMNHY